MKSVINGKKYDTEKAEKVLEYSYSNSSDFEHETFGFYRSEKGNWFLAGSGIIPYRPDEVLDLVEVLQDEIEVNSVFDYPEISELLETA